MIRFALLLCLLALISSAKAQKIYLGAKAGSHLGYALIDHSIFNLSINSGFEPGFNGGIYLKYLPAPKRNIFVKSGLQVSVNYFQKAWRQIFINGNPPYKGQLNMIEVPIEAIGYFGNKNNYFMTAGFYLEFLESYVLAEEPIFDPGTDNQVGGQDFYTYDPNRDNSVGYGFRGSVGIFRNFSFGQLHLEGFFSFSISNFIDGKELVSEVPNVSNLLTTGFSLGYLIEIGKKNKETN